MNAYATTAFSNAKTRLVIGWPLLVLAVAAYAPADALTRLVLVGFAALALVRGLPERPAKPSPARKAPAAAQPKLPTAKKAAAPRRTVPAQRTGRGARR